MSNGQASVNEKSGPSSPRPKIDLAEAKRFLNVLAPDGELTCQMFDDNEEKNGYLSQAFHVCNGTDDVTLKRLTGKRQVMARSGGGLAQLAELNERGAGIFVMVNQGDGQGRSENNVVRIRAVFVDLDGSPLEPVLECGVEPHVIVESSPGRYHAYWLVDDCPLELFPLIQKALAERFNGDPKVFDLPRVMRIPGFLHQKYEPFKSRIVSIREDISPCTTSII